MKHVRALVVMTVVAALATSACSKKSSDDKGAAHAATVEHLAGSAGAQVKLTDRAIERIGLETAKVRDASGDGAASGLALSNAAVLYDAEGKTWAYVTTAHGTYVRTAISVERFTADDAVLSAGPPAGSEVVTTGAAELFGAESTFGED
jgi:hypothetical protein